MRRHQRGASSLGVVLAQAAVLAVIGCGIGLVDAFLRPINLKIVSQDGQPQTAASAGVEVTTKPKAEEPGATPAPSPGPESSASAEGVLAAAEQPAPAAAAPSPTFRPTTEEELVGKPGHITLARALDMHQFMGAVFLDARSAEEFAAGHIQGAHRAGLDMFRTGDAPQILFDLPKDFPIVVYCSGGANCEASEDVALHLNGLGFFNVSVLHDGIVGWEAMGYPMERGGGQ